MLDNKINLAAICKTTNKKTILKDNPTEILTLAVAQGLQGGLVAERSLAGLHHQRQAGVDVLCGLLLLIW